GIFAVICSPIIGKLLPKIDARILVTVAFLLFGLVFYLRSLYTTEVDTWNLVLPTLLQGIPMAMFFIPLSMIILSGLPPEKIPAAAGLSNFARIFCGAVGTSIATTMWNDRSILHHSQLMDEATPFNPIFTSFVESTQTLLAMSKQQSYTLFNQLLSVQADMLGLNDIFYISAMIFIFLIPIVWLTKPEKAAVVDGEVAAAH
ncbi:MAG: hypothetical protein ACRC0M_07155, partial [Legionella sp.]